MSVQNAATTKMVQNVIDGTTPPTEAGNVTAEINGHAISDIFETDGVTVQNASLAAQATKLATGRTIRTNLGSTAAPSFDGTANVSPGVTGTLPVANGGTGQTNLADVTVGNATNAETSAKVKNALTAQINGDSFTYDGSSVTVLRVSSSNPNLLYNSNFVINQRGSSSYTSTGYTVDGWRKPISTGTVSWNINGVKPFYTSLSFPTSGSTYYIRQYIENFLRRDGTHYTVTIGYATSETAATVVGTHTFNVTSSTATQTYTYDFYTGYTITLFLYTRSSSSHDYLAIQRASSATTTLYIRYIKLEEGDVATPYEIPDPATELLKCQRYYVKYTQDTQLSGSVANAGNEGYATLFLPCPMRTTPTLVSYTANSLRISGSVSNDVTSVEMFEAENNKLMLKWHSSGSKDNFQPCILLMNEMVFSAELTS